MAPQTTSESAIQDEQKRSMDEEAERVLRAGRFLASPEPGEELVVTGMAGRFPDSDDVYHYRYNLRNKVDMVSCDNRRWEPTHPEIPQRTGKINYIEKFDAGFFGVHYRQADAMDPMCRQLLERTFEAILDAGFHPDELRGTNTGVFVGACFSETEKTWFYDKLESPAYGVTGCIRSMQAQRISYFFGLNGPSYVVDTACSSSLYAFEHAYRAIRMGRCDSAIVCGASLCLHPIVSLQFARLGVLSLDGSCKSFDADANGYARSEAVAVVILQKAKDARRIYAQVVHAKSNCDGYKEQGITFPSGTMQKQLLDETYQECGVDPGTVDFLEAHATGTKVGDPEEILAMDEVFCTENRKRPLLVGSIKSNLGHTEPASGMCSLVKVLLGMEDSCILPNINFDRPREGADALEKGRMVVVTDVTPWPKDGTGYAAINSFGFGGANCHVVLKRFMKEKTNKGQPRDNLPRLICISARIEEGIPFLLDDISKRPLDSEYVRILHQCFGRDIQAHPYRGYIIMSKTGELTRSYKWYDGERKSACFAFSGVDEEWLKVGKYLFEIPLFAATVQKIHNILSPKGFNVTEIINNGTTHNVEDVILGNIVIQIALADILEALELIPDSIIGYSIGELVAAYVDKALTLEQSVLCAYHIAQSLGSIYGGNTASYEVKLSKEEIQSILPNDVEIISYNSKKSHTIAGPAKKMEQLINDLQKKNVTVTKAKNHYGLHSKQIERMRTKLIEHLKEIIPKPKTRSPKWISSPGISQLASPEYFINILLNPVFFNDAISRLPCKGAVIEIGPKGLDLENFSHTNIIAEAGDDHSYIDAFLIGIGRVHELGYSLQLDKLYPKVQWPVCINTPMLSPLIKWNHDEDWYVALYKGQERMKSGERTISFSVKESDWGFVAGHVIDGRNLVPATGYLVMVWETFSMMLGELLSDMCVIFENVRFHRATNIPRGGGVELIVMVQRGTGQFEVAELGQAIVSGRIYVPENFADEVIQLPIPTEEEEEISFVTKDIYKELRLRGYNYAGVFRGLKSCNLKATKSMLEWKGNWVAFMDNMLQMKLLQEDTRNLYVPTGIERLAIDARGHIRYAKKFGEEPDLPVYVSKETGIIKSGGIEIRGLIANSIQRRKALGEPVLEKHKFIPFDTELSLEESIRVNIQILLENGYGIKYRTAELIDEATKEDTKPLGPLIHQAFSDQPLIQPDTIIFSKQPLELENIIVEDKKLASESRTCALVVASKLSSRPEILKQALTALKENGMIISREELEFNPETDTEGLSGVVIISVQQTEDEKLVLLRKSLESDKKSVIDISDCVNFDWLSTLQTSVKNDEKVIIYSQNAPSSGILGFFNCLRREPGGMNIKCVFIVDDNAPKFDVENEFYSKQLEKDLSSSVFKDGKWGSYKHLSIPKETIVEREHVFNNVTVRGDFSSLRWIEGPLHSNSVLTPEHTLIHIYYSSLNFRDIMTASGRISNDVVTRDRIEQYNVQGFEFSGRDSSGKRMMGMVTSGALASIVNADTYLIAEIPDRFTMEEAATLPVAYGTVLHGLVMVAQIKEGQSILIHAGSGGVGQAAINVATYYKCNIFTTVGTQEKREFIRNTFPHIPDSHIGNSRDTSFEQMVLRETNGHGVDIVLNSLSEEKLQASVRCLAPGGKFLEIGKFDLANNNTIGLKLFKDGRSFHGVMLDAFFYGDPAVKAALCELISSGLNNGCVKPLSRILFKEDEVEQAFRYMAGGKHIGKVMIKLRDEEPEKVVLPEPRLFSGIARFYGNSDNSYIISGGLGGFGLELADWLVLRGVRKLVLLSRTGLKTGYQASRIRIWKSYGVVTKILTADTTTREGCLEVIKDANELGPVEAIFNLAVVLRDSLLENQNVDNFKISLAPKAIATQHFDEISREMCPELSYFVVFSSVSCGRGNVGQTNYGMANSIMERICEKRKEDGYPALAIQWGAIGEVGLVAEMQELQTEIEIGGTLQQRISSCLDVMDTFLKQDEAIVSSIVVAEKKGGAGGADNIVDAVKNILGLRDLKTISLHSSLSELGMDSMMAVEIKQTLEREYEVFLTAQDIRSMTFARLQEIALEKASEGEHQKTKSEDKEKLPVGVYMLFRYMGNEEHATIPMIRLPSLVKEKSVAPKIFLLPGIEGMATVLEPLAANLASHALCLQYTYTDNPESSIEDLAKFVLPNIQENLPKTTPFTLVAYSYGCIVALQVAALLEAEGRIGRVILIDGSPSMFKELIKQQVPDTDSEAILQTLVLCALMQLYIPLEIVMQHKMELYNCKTFDDRVKTAMSHAPEDTPHSEDYQRRVCVASYLRMRSVLNYQPKFRKLKSMVKLFKPLRPTIENYDEDYKIQEFCENPIEINTFEGNHLTILKNTQVAYTINTIIDTSSVYFKQSIMKDKAEAESLKEVGVKQI